jgi:hypothetical protein
VRFDFNNYASFKHIDRDGDGVIDTYNLSNFLKNNGHYASEREVLNIIRRIDTDGDAKLNYEEFADFLKLSVNSSSSMMEDSYKSRSYSAEKMNRSLVASGSPLRKKSSNNSPSRGMSASHRGMQARNMQTPERHSSPMRESSFSGSKQMNKSF